MGEETRRIEIYVEERDFWVQTTDSDLGKRSTAESFISQQFYLLSAFAFINIWPNMSSNVIGGSLVVFRSCCKNKRPGYVRWGTTFKCLNPATQASEIACYTLMSSPSGLNAFRLSVMTFAGHLTSTEFFS